MLEPCLKDEIINGGEGCDFPIPVDDKGKGGRLDAPIDNTPSRPDSLPRSVMARVAFMPMSQSACERARAESRRLA